MGIIKEKDERDGYIYDARIKRGDTDFWSIHSGAIAVDTGDSTTAVRINAARLHTYLQHIYGQYDFSLNVPVNPSTATDHTWGLRNPTNDTTLGDSGITAGGIFFSVDTDLVFQTVSHDDFGNVQTTVVTWDTDWSGQQTRFTIRWEKDIVNFLVNDSVIATHSDRVPTQSQSIEVRNATASNLDLAYVRVARAGAIV